jgi:hypothetical protein
VLTEKQAWLKLADLWSQPTKNEFGEHYVQVYVDESAYGLCACTRDLLDYNLIDMETYVVMNARIEMYRQTSPRKEKSFLWGQDWFGAKERESFCKRQAEKCVG